MPVMFECLNCGMSGSTSSDTPDSSISKFEEMMPHKCGVDFVFWEISEYEHDKYIADLLSGPRAPDADQY